MGLASMSEARTVGDDTAEEVDPDLWCPFPLCGREKEPPLKGVPFPKVCPEELYEMVGDEAAELA